MSGIGLNTSFEVTCDFPVEAGINHGIPDAELRSFIAEPAPRRVPRHILENLRIATGGVRVQWWVKGVLGLLFCCFLVPAIFLFSGNVMPSVALLMGWTETARGTVVSYSKSSGQVRSGNGPWQDIYHVTVEFDTADGRRITTSCEVVGEASLPKNADGESVNGAPVTVSYYPRDPRTAAIPCGDIFVSVLPGIMPGIVGMALCLVFLFIALMFLIPFLYWGIRERRFRRILSEGEAGIAVMDSIEGTGFTINGQRVHNVRLRIASRSGEWSARLRTRGPRVEYLRSLQAEGRRLAVLFLPENPNRLALLGVEEG